MHLRVSSSDKGKKVMMAVYVDDFVIADNDADLENL